MAKQLNIKKKFIIINPRYLCLTKLYEKWVIAGLFFVYCDSFQVIFTQYPLETPVRFKRGSTTGTAPQPDNSFDQFSSFSTIKALHFKNPRESKIYGHFAAMLLRKQKYNKTQGNSKSSLSTPVQIFPFGKTQNIFLNPPRGEVDFCTFLE